MSPFGTSLHLRLPKFVAYWNNNGQRSVLTLDGYAAIDPKMG